MNAYPPDPTKTTVASNFNSITIENAMKWDSIQNPDGTFNFGPADDEVNWAAANRLRVRAHTLLFHRPSVTPWAKAAILNAADPQAKAHEMIRSLITKVVGHFRGRVATWDVVNEPLGEFSPPTAQDACPWGNGWDVNDSCPFTGRNFFYTTLGETYIDEAFKLAHAADPNAKLFLNELLWNPAVGDAKADALLALVKRLKDRGVPIDGVGLELHGAWGVYEPMFPGTKAEFKANSPTMARLVDYINRLGALGVRVEFTEVDLSMQVIKSSISTLRPDLVSDSQALAAQAQLFGRIGRSCAVAPACSGITVWGLTDPETWLSASAPWQVHRPLLFDENFQPKAGYATLRDAMLERCPLRGTQPVACSRQFTAPASPTVTWASTKATKLITATFVAGTDASAFTLSGASGTKSATGSCVVAQAPAKTVCKLTAAGGSWTASVTASNSWSSSAPSSKTIKF
jgi:endo-1,4-beta-xylanase